MTGRTILAAGALGALLLGPGALAQEKATETATAVFAGGCFWCTEADFDKVPGVLDTVSGYAGGTLENPGYEEVTAGGTGHREAVKVTYDPGKVSFEELLTYYWRTVDPTDAGGQFCDRGESYTTAVFTGTPEQMELAQKQRERVAAQLGTPVATRIEPLDEDGFWPAEAYHQDYYQTNPVRYRFYRWNCGRDQRLEALWGASAGKLPEG